MTWTPGFTLADYDRLLVRLIRHGYAIRPVEDMPARAGDGSRVVFLRHDIDADPLAAPALAEIEERLGVRSTWMVATGLHYNPGYGPNSEAIQRLHARGHRIGVHYLNGQPPAWAGETLEELVGVGVTSCCAHAPLSVPAHRDEILGTLGLIVQPHHPDFAVPYLSDSRRQWQDPAAIAQLAAGEGPGQVHLNLHPEHWAGFEGETRHQAAARITANMLAATTRAAREITDAWNLP